MKKALFDIAKWILTNCFEVLGIQVIDTTEVLWVYIGFSAISVSTKIFKKPHTFLFENSESTESPIVMILFRNISSALLLTFQKATGFDSLVTSVI